MCKRLRQGTLERFLGLETLTKLRTSTLLDQCEPFLKKESSTYKTSFFSFQRYGVKQLVDLQVTARHFRGVTADAAV